MRTFAVFLFSSVYFLGTASGQPYTISTVAGTDRLVEGGPATSAPLRLSVAVAVDAQGNLSTAPEFFYFPPSAAVLFQSPLLTQSVADT